MRQNYSAPGQALLSAHLDRRMGISHPQSFSAMAARPMRAVWSRCLPILAPMTCRKALQMFCKGMPAWWLVHTGAWLLRLDLMTPSACQIGLMQNPQILLK